MGDGRRAMMIPCRDRHRIPAFAYEEEIFAVVAHMSWRTMLLGRGGLIATDAGTMFAGLNAKADR
jgi:hypothetical protein